MGEKLYPSRLGEYLAVLVPTEMFTQVIPASGEAGFYPSGRGGHKNSENVATFSEFLGREEKPSLPAHRTSLGRRKNFSPALNPECFYRASPGIGKTHESIPRA